MITESLLPDISIIDTIGAHSGLQHYNQGLSGVLEEVGFKVNLVSNFSPTWTASPTAPILENFYQGGIFHKLKQLATSYLAYLVHLLPKVPRKQQWWLYESYGLRTIDFLFLLPLLLVRKRMIFLVHDVFSITSPEGPVSRWFKIHFYRLVPLYVILHSSEAKRTLQATGYKGLLLETPTFPTAAHMEVDRTNLENDIKNAVEQGDRILLLFFGSLRPSKGLDTALAAIRSMPPAIQQRLHLIVAGRDSNGLLGTPGYEVESDLPITILDRFVSDEEQAFLFQQCDILLLPYREIYQSGVIEIAIANRVPFLASNLPTFCDILSEHPSFGFIYGDGIRELAAYLERFTQEPNLLHNMYLEADLRAHVQLSNRCDLINTLRCLVDPSK